MSAYMGFKDAAGKEWDPITLSPPKTINCPLCEAKVTTLSIKPMNPAIHVYRCACGHSTLIRETQTIEHWPEATRAEYDAGWEAWRAAGCPIKEVIGTVIYNPLGVTQIEP